MRKNSLFMWLSVGAGEGAVRHLSSTPELLKKKKYQNLKKRENTKN
jgi:hypothetical protein